MIIALFYNTLKKTSYNLAKGIKEFLIKNNVTVVADDKNAKSIEALPISDIHLKEIDFLISLGGDGTILRLIHQHPEIDAPLIGINLGHMGFMTEIPVSDIYPSLQDLLQGSYKIENRIMIEGKTAQNKQCFAINEMVVHRAKNPSLVELAIHVDGSYLNTFAADGVIISTPSGSTAYSLAAGGPILAPELDAFVLTPISPHTISNRPIVFMPKQEIQIEYISRNEPVEISFDGIARYNLRTGEVFHISKSPKKFKLVNILRHDYFSILRNKLGWTGGKIRK